jgi:hypothetical protein
VIGGLPAGSLDDLLRVAVALVAFGALVVGVVWFAAARRSSARTLRARRASADDPRWSNEGPPQRVGQACAACSGIVRTERESVACELCERICHVACLARHCGAAHAPAQRPFHDGGGSK